MSDLFLEKLFEHNNWANGQIIQACMALSDEQLDAQPASATVGSIRQALLHMVTSQRGYLAFLTLPLEARPLRTPIAFAELPQSARTSGEGLLALARGEQKPFGDRLRSHDGYEVAPWVVMVQAINHATEHREQIKSMLSALGVTPPEIDGWSYAEVVQALRPIEK